MIHATRLLRKFEGEFVGGVRVLYAVGKADKSIRVNEDSFESCASQSMKPNVKKVKNGMGDTTNRLALRLRRRGRLKLI